MLGLSIGVGVLATLSATSLYEKAGSTKYTSLGLLTFTLLVYISVITQQFESECQAINLFLLLCVLPTIYLSSSSWKNAFILLFIETCIISIFLAVSAYLGSLSHSYLEDTLEVLDNSLQLLTQVYCSLLLILGYSYVPELLISPSLSHILKKVNLDYLKYAIERAKSNISFKYTCRGLTTPKFEKKNLKAIEREREQIEYKLAKLEKTPLKYKTVQALAITTGCLILCSGFWVLALLTGILVENFVVSSCGLHCGFDSLSRISSLISDYELYFSLISGFFYISASLCGHLSLFTDPSQDVSSESNFGLIFTSVCSSFGLKTLLSFFYPAAFPTVFRPLQYTLNAVLVTFTFFYFVYCHFFKCKKR